jgi:hypothetical protein
MRAGNHGSRSSIARVCRSPGIHDSHRRSAVPGSRCNEHAASGIAANTADWFKTAQAGQAPAGRIACDHPQDSARRTEHDAGSRLSIEQKQAVRAITGRLIPQLPAARRRFRRALLFRRGRRRAGRAARGGPYRTEFGRFGCGVGHRAARLIYART